LLLKQAHIVHICIYSRAKSGSRKAHKLKKIRILALLIGVAVLPAAAAGSPQAILLAGGLDGNEAAYAPQDIQAGDILDLLYLGQSKQAISLAESYIEVNPNDPLPRLMMARTLRELLPEQDDNKELIKENAYPIHERLDEAIDLCERGLKLNDGDMRLRFYRGWAWMFKAQLHALGGSYWSAGRAAAKGNKDLEKYISNNPDDPDAKGILGTFLYFADTLPSVVKIIKTLFLIPGGDREKGLEYLRFACTRGGLLQTDHQIVLGAIYTIFEGRFEEGVNVFTSLLDRHPDYLRLVEPLAIVRTFYPGKIQYLQNIEQNAIARSRTSADAGIHAETIQRLRYHRSYANMFFESPSHAIAEFSSLIAEAPGRPDWLVPLSLVNLGCLYANSGQKDKAKEAFRQVLQNEEMERFHDIASDMVKTKDAMEEPLLAGDGSFIHNIYFMKPASAESALRSYQREKGSTVLYEFYRGETMLLSGSYEAAARHYQNALDLEVPVYSQAYQMLAAVRIAEIKGMEGDYKAARHYLDEGLDYYHKEFLIDMLIEGRKRFYERLEKGELEVNPSVLIANPSPRHSLPQFKTDQISQ
jgi:tetratricopeptide (TPR) repeat protein